VFDYKDSGKEFGAIVYPDGELFKGQRYASVIWRFLRCSGCGRGALAKMHVNGTDSVVETFFPATRPCAALPPTVPAGVAAEYREAELCASVAAWRAASALLRSTLEKVLKANGYKKGSLEAKIDEAAADGVITAARSQKAHDDIRVLGNEVVHDEWREVMEEEVTTALHYVQRVIEDLYDDRPTVESLLKSKGRVT
jgi:hypothetical protein